MKTKLITIAALTLWLTACASVGKQVSQDAANQFVEGKSTEADVVAQLGKPTSVTTNHGKKTLEYSGGTGHASATSFIPLVGAFLGTTHYDSSTAIYEFDAKGILRNVTFSSSSGETGSAAGRALN